MMYVKGTLLVTLFTMKFQYSYGSKYLFQKLDKY